MILSYCEVDSRLRSQLFAYTEYIHAWQAGMKRAHAKKLVAAVGKHMQQ